MEATVLYVLMCFGAWRVVDCQTLVDSKRLMSDMLSGYDKRHRPVLDQSKPIIVNISFEIVAIQDFDEIEETFSVVGVLYMSWIDESINWLPDSYGGIWSQLYRSEDVWYPKLVLANPYNTVKDISDDWMTVRILFNGVSSYAPGAVFKTTCSADVTYYPFDTQTCGILFISNGYGNAEVKLELERPDVGKTTYSENGEWELDSTQAEKYSTILFDTITFTFNIKRKPLFLVVNVILPIIFMAMINILVFLLPVESGERVSFATTVLLAIAVFLTLVGDNLPKTSEPMSLLCYFLMIILIISTLICVMAIFNLHLYYKRSKVPRWLVSLTLCVTCKGSPRCKPHKHVEHTGTLTDIGLHRSRMDSQKEPTDHTASMMAIAEELDDITQDVTWKDVSTALDKLSAICFSLTLMATVVFFLDILVNNRQL